MKPHKTRGKQFVDQKFVRTGWIKQYLEDCRFAAIEMYDSAIEDCEFRDCKFSTVNWRTSKFKRVTFKDCIFDKVDFSGSEFKSVEFINCTWEEVNFSNCTVGVKKLVLTDTKFVNVAGVESLGGHELSYEQAIALLPQLLAVHEIKIGD